MIVYCGCCGDEFDPIEGMEPVVGAEEPAWCSDECADSAVDDDLNSEAYDSAGDAAPVF